MSFNALSFSKDDVQAVQDCAERSHIDSYMETESPNVRIFGNEAFGGGE